MKVVIQKVRSAKAVFEDKVIAQIGAGAVLYIGIEIEDSEDTTDWLPAAIADEKGEFLVLSQFTLLGTFKGSKPSFHRARCNQEALDYFGKVCQGMKQAFLGRVQTGVFGKSLDIHLELSGEGDVTRLLENPGA